MSRKAQGLRANSSRDSLLSHAAPPAAAPKPGARQNLMRVMDNDVRFLRACNIIDYSLVVAVQHGNFGVLAAAATALDLGAGRLAVPLGEEPRAWREAPDAVVEDASDDPVVHVHYISTSRVLQ